MPIAINELKNKWKSESDAIDYLEQKGFKIQIDYSWKEPYNHNPTSKEKSAIMYLIQEHDYI